MDGLGTGYWPATAELREYEATQIVRSRLLVVVLSAARAWRNASDRLRDR